MIQVPLHELDPWFIVWTDDTHWRHLKDDVKTRYTIEEADGLQFDCPLCYVNNGWSSIGVHSIICWEPNVPQTTSPNPGRWTMTGTSLDDLTLVAGSSSIHLTGEGCGAHFHIRNGQCEW